MEYSKVSFSIPFFFFFFSLNILVFAFLTGYATCEELGPSPPTDLDSPPKSNNTECLNSDLRRIFQCFYSLIRSPLTDANAAENHVCCKVMRALVQEDRPACICRILSFKFVRGPLMKMSQIFSTCGLTLDSISSCH